jgi:hypothetical protein
MYLLVYPTAEGPQFHRGHGVTMGLLALAAVIYGSMSAYFSYANRRRSRGDEDSKKEGMTADEIEELGDRSPKYVYTT